MNLLILGASGQTGIHVVRQSLAAGHTVTAFVRDPAKLRAEHHGRLRIQKGDARNVADLELALRGQDAVISALGTRKLSDDLISVSTAALVAAMSKAGARRLVMLSSFVVSDHFKQNLLTKLMAKFSPGITTDKASGENMLKSSTLDWTIIHAATLRNGPFTGKYRLGDFPVTMADHVNRADVAAALLDVAVNGTYIRQSAMVSS